MSRLTTEEVWHTFWEADDFEVGFKDCIGDARFSISEIEQHAVITLKEINYRCPRPPSKELMRAYFEKEFVNKLNEPVITMSAKVNSIWGIPKEPNPEATPSPASNKPRSVKRKN